ncbi:MAG: ABC transporter permease, partial [Anaerolineae bacterium]|nr:ABC transporter permease [Anaerolineae bacterium]
MKTWSIAWKDLQILIKDRGIFLQLFLLPLLFVLVFSGALGAVGGEEPDQGIPLAVVDLDGGDAAQALIADIDAAGGVRVQPYPEAEAMALVKEKEIPRVLVVPAGFTEALAAGIGPGQTLHLINHPEADKRQTEVVRLVVDGVAQDASLEIQMMAALQQMGEMQAGAPGADQAFAVERMQAQARNQFVSAQAQPLVRITRRVPGKEASEEEGAGLGLADIAVPGVTVLFVFYTAQTMARSIYDEKKVGSFRRLLAAPVSKMSLLVGKMVPNFLIGLVQGAVIFAFGLVGLELLGLTPISLGDNPFIPVLILVLVALCSSALGILIAAVARTEGQIGGLSTLVLWVMAVVGGSL